MYSEQVATSARDFISARMQAKLTAQETAMGLAAGTITPLVSLTWCEDHAEEYPKGVLYDFDGDDFTSMTLAEDQKVYNFTLEFTTRGGEIPVQRRNLLAYRDAAVKIIEENPQFDGIFTQVVLKRVEPGILMKKDGSYNGNISVYFKIEI